MSDTSSLSGLFKNVYDSGSDVLTVQQNLHAKTWGMIKKSPLKPSANGVFNAVAMAGNENGSAINENQGFQQPGSLDPVQPRILSKLVVWPFEVTGSSIRLSETDPQAFAQSLDAQQEDNAGRMMSDLNRQSLGVGTGQMALTTAAVVASTTIPVDQITVFRRNQKIDIWTAIGGTREVTSAIITFVDFDASAIVVSAAVTCSNNAIVVKTTVLDGVSTAASAKEINGLRLIADDGTFATTFEGVPLATNPEWAGNVIDGAAGPVSQDLLQKTANRQFVVGGGECDWLMSNVGQARTFLNTELNKVRYEPAKVEGGHTILKWNDKTWMIDKDYALKEVGMYNSNFIEKFEVRDVHIADLDGKTVDRINGYDKIAGYYVYQGDIGTWKRNAHAKLVNLFEPAL